MVRIGVHIVKFKLRSHNSTKSSSNCSRISLEEQIEYIEAVVSVQKIVAKRMGVDLHDEIIKAIIARLRLVY